MQCFTESRNLVYSTIYFVISQLFRAGKPLKFCRKRSWWDGYFVFHDRKEILNSLLLSCLPMAIITLFFPRIRWRKVRQWGILNSKLWTELSTLALPPVIAFAEACRRPQRSAALPSGHLRVELGKSTCTPPMAWLEYHREIKSSHKNVLCGLKNTHWKKNEHRHLNGNRRQRFIFTDFQLVLRLLERHPVNL